jgi:hypothetical protein
MRTLPAYDGPVEAPLRSSPDEILRELIGVIEAAQDKSIKLTKSGIPPKPLWAAVNDRLIWQDPKSVLYDWDEVDQIRFVYSLAARLLLVQPDGERELTVGPGADAFFFAAPSRRAQMLLNAYVDVVDWDERCDARNDQGHRYNFGQTFRRDVARKDEQSARFQGHGRVEAQVFAVGLLAAAVAVPANGLGIAGGGDRRDGASRGPHVDEHVHHVQRGETVSGHGRRSIRRRAGWPLR